MKERRKYMKLMNIKMLKTLVLVFLMPSCLLGQTVITGEIDQSLGIDSFEIKYTINFAEHESIFTRGRHKTVPVQDGKFWVQLEGNPDVFYVLFRLPKNSSEDVGDAYRRFGNTANVFAIKPGTTIDIKICPEKISFLGDQSKLMECQMELFNLYVETSKESIRLNNLYGPFEGEDQETIVEHYMQAYKDAHDAAIHAAKKILSTYSDDLDTLTLNALYYDFVGFMKYYEINKINLKVHVNDAPLRNYFADSYDRHYINQDDLVESQKYTGRAVWYPRYLAYKALTDILMKLTPLGRRVQPTLPLVLDLISERYQGNLYDQVAFCSFLHRSPKEYIDDMTFTTILGNIENEEYRSYIEERGRRLTGRASYQFALEDRDGTIYTNEDFKGDVILMDFWFTGCRGCLALHQNMKPVKEYFKGNPNFKYVSISIDKHKEKWKRSLDAGEYTDETDIKLWLGELGNKHPIIEYYGVSSYPTLILVDKNDNIIAINPPNPYTAKNKNTLIGLIEEALRQ